MTSISIFDMLKIGIGPSSSHTLGPWKAALLWLNELKQNELFDTCAAVKVDLYGSLSLTGKGHATDIAIVLGLTGADPERFETEKINPTIQKVRSSKLIDLNGEIRIEFDMDSDIRFHKHFLGFHPNGMKFTAISNTGNTYASEFFSIGGGFVIKEDESDAPQQNKVLPFPINSADDLLNHCKTNHCNIPDIVIRNEKSWRSEAQIDADLKAIWNTMLQALYRGCHETGILPGGLKVKRRAPDLHKKLIGKEAYTDPESWLQAIRKTEVKFRQILKWVSCFALSVNEVNAALGRVVTAPTNGSSGVIPAVLMYYLTIENHQAGFEEIKKFLLIAGEIGCIFKKNATISAALGGCQAEIGVSSAMAAGALTGLLGGNCEQITTAAEIAMEHHLGLTCDPIGGLVQIPCIERNSMGAIKAISAAELALETDYNTVKVSLDEVIETMWETAKDMNHKYKETSEGGLAISVRQPDC